MHKAFGDAASYQYAQIHAALGDRDEAFASLAAARRVHDPGLMGQVYVDPSARRPALRSAVTTHSCANSVLQARRRTHFAGFPGSRTRLPN